MNGFRLVWGRNQNLLGWQSLAGNLLDSFKLWGTVLLVSGCGGMSTNPGSPPSSLESSRALSGYFALQARDD
jgi:hypothetical protein